MRKSIDYCVGLAVGLAIVLGLLGVSGAFGQVYDITDNDDALYLAGGSTTEMAGYSNTQKEWAPSSPALIKASWVVTAPETGEYQVLMFWGSPVSGMPGDFGLSAWTWVGPGGQGATGTVNQSMGAFGEQEIEAYNFVVLSSNVVLEMGETVTIDLANQNAKACIADAVAIWKTGDAVETPVAVPPGGNYEGTQNVELSSGTMGAAIYYTLNGTTPTEASALYSTAISVSSSLTLKARAFLMGSAPSNVLTASYVITPPTVATPTFDPAGGSYTDSETVTIATTTAGATIHYTTDGSTPTTASPVYSAPLLVDVGKTIKAKAVKSGMTSSAVGSATYSIGGGGGPFVLNATGETQAVNLSWSASQQVGTWTHYRIYRQGGTGPWFLLATVPFSSLAYTDSAVLASVPLTYQYYVAPWDGSQEGAPTPIASAEPVYEWEEPPPGNTAVPYWVPVGDLDYDHGEHVFGPAWKGARKPSTKPFLAAMLTPIGAGWSPGSGQYPWDLEQCGSYQFKIRVQFSETGTDQDWGQSSQDAHLFLIEVGRNGFIKLHSYRPSMWDTDDSRSFPRCALEAILENPAGIVLGWPGTNELYDYCENNQLPAWHAERVEDALQLLYDSWMVRSEEWRAMIPRCPDLHFDEDGGGGGSAYDFSEYFATGRTLPQWSPGHDWSQELTVPQVSWSQNAGWQKVFGVSMPSLSQQPIEVSFAYAWWDFSWNSETWLAGQESFAVLIAQGRVLFRLGFSLVVTVGLIALVIRRLGTLG